MPTMKDIAREAGVSHGTVSNVLNKTGKVSIEKIRLVEEAAKRLGVELSECVVVEDSVSAITHAKENGAGCIIAIGNENAKEEIMKIGVDQYIRDFTEMKFEWFE